MAIYSGFTSKKMVIFHSYVKLPEGSMGKIHSNPMKFNSFTTKNVSPFFMFNKPAWTLTWGTSDCSYDHQTQRLTMINYTSPLLLVYKPPRGVWFKDDAVQPHVAVVGLPLNPWIGFYRTICRTTTIFHGKFHGKKIFNGKIYKKSLHLMVNTMVFCRFSLKPIQWLKMLCLSFTSAGNYYHFRTEKGTHAGTKGYSTILSWWCNMSFTK